MAKSFNGSSDFVAVAGGEVGDDGDFSLGMWFKSTSTANSVPFGESSTANNDQLAIFGYFEDSPDNRFKFLLRNDASSVAIQVISGNDYSDDTWRFACVTYAGTTLTLYVDFSSLGTDTGTIGTITLNTRQIGRLLRTSAILYFAGEVAGAFAIAKALSIGEQRAMAYGRWATKPAGFWHLFGAAADAPDHSGNGRNGSVTGTTVVDHAPIPPPFGFDPEWLGAFAEVVGVFRPRVMVY